MEVSYFENIIYEYFSKATTEPIKLKMDLGTNFLDIHDAMFRLPNSGTNSTPSIPKIDLNTITTALKTNSADSNGNNSSGSDLSNTGEISNPSDLCVSLGITLGVAGAL